MPTINRCLTIASALTLATMLGGCLQTTGEEIAKGPPVQVFTDVRPLTAAEKSALGKSLANSALKDPSSARFRWMPVAYSKETSGAVYCGWVNGKNSYGGYTGFKPFNANITRNAKGEFFTGEIVHIRQDEEKYDNESTIQFCRKAGYDNMDQAN